MAGYRPDVAIFAAGVLGVVARNSGNHYEKAECGTEMHCGRVRAVSITFGGLVGRASLLYSRFWLMLLMWFGA